MSWTAFSRWLIRNIYHQLFLWLCPSSTSLIKPYLDFIHISEVGNCHNSSISLSSPWIPFVRVSLEDLEEILWKKRYLRFLVLLRSNAAIHCQTWNINSAPVGCSNLCRMLPVLYLKWVKCAHMTLKLASMLKSHTQMTTLLYSKPLKYNVMKSLWYITRPALN